MAKCVPNERIEMNIRGIRKTVPYVSHQIPSSIQYASMKSCTDSCQAGMCQPSNYQNVRSETFDGGVQLPSNVVADGVPASIDDCLHQCNENSSCKAVSHTPSGICNHYSSIESQSKLNSGHTKLYSRTERT